MNWAEFTWSDKNGNFLEISGNVPPSLMLISVVGVRFRAQKHQLRILRKLLILNKLSCSEVVLHQRVTVQELFVNLIHQNAQNSKIRSTASMRKAPSPSSALLRRIQQIDQRPTDYVPLASSDWACFHVDFPLNYISRAKF